MTSIYFAQVSNRVKIGRARDVAARLAQLQTGSSSPLRLVAVLDDVPESLERRLHQFFAADRLHGEWFQVSAPLASLMHHIRNGARPTSESAISHYASLTRHLHREDAELQKARGEACQSVRKAARSGRPWADVRAEYVAQGGVYEEAALSYERRYVNRDRVNRQRKRRSPTLHVSS